jgi:hypothetical protein
LSNGGEVLERRVHASEIGYDLKPVEHVSHSKPGCRSHTRDRLTLPSEFVARLDQTHDQRCESDEEDIVESEATLSEAHRCKCKHAGGRETLHPEEAQAQAEFENQQCQRIALVRQAVHHVSRHRHRYQRKQ